MNIELIPWTEANPDDIARIFNEVDRSYLADGLPTPYTREHLEKWLNEDVLPNEGTRGLFRVIYVSGSCAGDVQLRCKEGAYRRDADLGYVLLDAYRGQGVMTEAVRRICADSFEKLDILRISARIYAPNVASRRVLEKNGFQLEGRMRQAVCKGEKVYDMLLYGRLREG